MHDKNKKTVTYDNAKLEIFDIPVFVLSKVFSS